MQEIQYADPTSILIVDDDDALRKQVRFSLEERFHVSEAGDRREAFNKLEEGRIDIVLLDLGLPPFENVPDQGLELLRHIMQNSSAKVIIFTGQKTEGIALDAIKAGAFDYLLKPVSIEKLLFSIDRAVLFKRTEEAIERQGTKKIYLNVKMGEGLHSLIEDAEKNIIQNVLKETDFNVYKSAKLLGLKRESLYYFMNKFGIKRPDEN